MDTFEILISLHFVMFYLFIFAKICRFLRKYYKSIAAHLRNVSFYLLIAEFSNVAKRQKKRKKGNDFLLKVFLLSS